MIRYSVVTPQRNHEKIYRVTYNRMRGDCFTVHKVNIFTRQLLDYPRGIYWLNTKDTDGKDSTILLNVGDKSNSSVSSYIVMAIINAVDYKRSGYTCRSCLKAQLTLNIQYIIRIFYTKDYKHYVANNDMIDCPISLAYVNTAEYISIKDK